MAINHAMMFEKNTPRGVTAEAFSFTSTVEVSNYHMRPCSSRQVRRQGVENEESKTSRINLTHKAVYIIINLVLIDCWLVSDFPIGFD